MIQHEAVSYFTLSAGAAMSRFEDAVSAISVQVIS